MREVGASPSVQVETTEGWAGRAGEEELCSGRSLEGWVQLPHKGKGSL